MQILRPNQYATYNQWAPGKIGADASKPDSYWQVNQGQADQVAISHAFATGAAFNQVVACDGKDNVDLMDGDWKIQNDGNLVHDDASGADGYLYKDDRGDQVLISGIDKNKIRTNTFGHYNDVNGGLTDIENSPKNSSGGKDGFVTADEIQNALDDNTIKGDGRTYWQGVVNSLKNDAAAGTNNTHSSTRKGGQGQDLVGVTTNNLMDAERSGINFGTVKAK